MSDHCIVCGYEYHECHCEPDTKCLDCGRTWQWHGEDGCPECESRNFDMFSYDGPPDGEAWSGGIASNH